MTTPKNKKTIAVIQSNYIPWIGYFSMMAEADVFIVYECVQYTKNDWRNRNIIQASDGRFLWLTIPIRHCHVNQLFMDTMVVNPNWAANHFQTLRHNFSKSIGWDRHQSAIKALYEQAAEKKMLYEINRIFIEWVVKTLGITTKLIFLESYPDFSSPTERLISILKDHEATHYLSGPSASNYVDLALFQDANIDFNYVQYNELISKFLTHSEALKQSSILQLIFEGKYEFRNHRS